MSNFGLLASNFGLFVSNFIANVGLFVSNLALFVSNFACSVSNFGCSVSNLVSNFGFSVSNFGFSSYAARSFSHLETMDASVRILADRLSGDRPTHASSMSGRNCIVAADRDATTGRVAILLVSSEEATTSCEATRTISMIVSAGREIETQTRG